MAKDVSAGLRSNAIHFGRVVGGAFAVLGLIAAWREHVATARVFLTLAAVLVLLSFVAPLVLVPIERAWMGIAHAISRVTTPIFMAALFFLVVTPLGLVRRAVGRRGLPQFRSGETAWHRRAEGSRRSDLNRQF